MADGFNDPNGARATTRHRDVVDDRANPLKLKGVGELGICGAGAAIANAVYNACGVRIREFPLTLDKVLAGLKS